MTEKRRSDKRVLAIVDFDGACGHSFHVSCLRHWLDARQPYDETMRCPVCKEPVMDEWVDTTYSRSWAHAARQSRGHSGRGGSATRICRSTYATQYLSFLPDGVPVGVKRGRRSVRICESARRVLRGAHRFREAWRRDTERRERLRPEMRRMREEQGSVDPNHRGAARQHRDHPTRRPPPRAAPRRAQGVR